ncbi:hypothetical protein Goari_021376 [Gossypium aridum]|uniref:Dol-P-Glc:Glc(2)Man(9)GlcNAc(2)-PP-Dol alpha-1,2-glucosyltransferase n=1 Tax=Gossypium aridum TaxID=34290 RepID=A0A7J8YE42_GOSAI|nr:hypothetical protein [Gossypium aridum]
MQRLINGLFTGQTRQTPLQPLKSQWKLSVSFSPFFFVLLAFVSFLFWNGSVVLGVKEAHAVSPKFAQIMYISLISLFLRLLYISQQVMLHSSINNSQSWLLTSILYIVLNIFMMRMFVLAVPLGT